MIQKNKNLGLAIIISTFLFIGAFFMVNVPLTADYATISSINVVLFAWPAFWALFRWLGKRDAVIMSVVLGLYALTIESIGLLTGFPYGEFLHSPILGFKLFGVVPWTVAFAWTPLILAGIVLTRRTIKSVFLRIIVLSLFLVLLDLTLDPGAVYLKFWKYETAGTYYQVPVSNFIGWLFSGLIGATIAELLVLKFKPLLPAPVQLIIGCFYILLFWTAIAFWAGLTIPLLFGVFTLIGLTVFYYRFYYAFGEMIVVVDDENRPLEIVPKNEVHNAETKLHRAFSVFLFNEKGEFLLQRRAFEKKTWGGIWSNSCCGHLMLHESVENAAHRRIRYELGVRSSKLKLILPAYRYRAEKNGVVENEICPVLVGQINSLPKPNPQEIAEIAWVKWSEFLDQISTSNHDFSPWAAQEAELLNENEDFQRWLG